MASRKHPRSVDDTDREAGRRMKILRLALNLSQEELGAKLGVSFQQIQKYEKGSNRISLGRAKKIANVLKCSIDHLAAVDGRNSTDGATINPEMIKFFREWNKIDPRYVRSLRMHLRELNGGEDA
jgi:transcriptional regulator with XRE-family HTH domain